MSRSKKHVGPPDGTFGCKEALNALMHVSQGLSQRQAQLGSWNLIWLFV